MAIQILFQAHGLLAVDKPAGLSVHAAPGPGRSVLRALDEELGFKNLTPVHRLDKDASGVLLFAESKALASEVQAAWGQADKRYLALCAGIPDPENGVIDAPILEHQTGKPERLRNAVRYFEKMHPDEKVPPLPAPKTSAVHPAGRPSRTAYAVVEKFAAFVLLEVRPQQGRMHQIRVHLAHIGHPLALDPLYGTPVAAARALTRLPLHAAHLSFPFRGEIVSIAAPLAEDIGAFVRGLGK